MVLIDHLSEVLFRAHPLSSNLFEHISKKELMDFVNQRLNVLDYNRKQQLLGAGEVSEKLYFVNKGLVRGYYYNETEDKENTFYLWKEDAFVMDIQSFIYGSKGKLYVEALAGTELLSISKHALFEVFDQFRGTEVFLTCLTLFNIEYIGSVNNDLRHLSAWERYVKLIKTYPNIEQKISKEIIASYISITPQSLSRMIKENGHP